MACEFSQALFFFFDQICAVKNLALSCSDSTLSLPFAPKLRPMVPLSDLGAPVLTLLSMRESILRAAGLIF